MNSVLVLLKTRLEQTICLFALPLLIMLPFNVFGAEVLSVSLINKTNHIVLSIVLDQKVTTKTVSMGNPNRFVLDLANINHTDNQNKFVLDSGNTRKAFYNVLTKTELQKHHILLGIRTSSRENKSFRFVFDLAPKVSGTIVKRHQDISGAFVILLFFSKDSSKDSNADIFYE